MSLRDVRERIDSVKNIEKITRAMEMVAAARLRKAEQRIYALRPYADALRLMTRNAAAASEKIPSLPIMERHASEQRIALLLVTGDRGLAGVFNSQILRAGHAHAEKYSAQGLETRYSVVGRRGVSSLRFRGADVVGAYTGFTDRPTMSDARLISGELEAAYIDGQVDRVEIIYNGFISALSQEVRHEVLLPLEEATIFGMNESVESEVKVDQSTSKDSQSQSLVEYEPDAEHLLRRLIPEYVETSIFRALLESTASEHGARMTAMRNAAENAGDLIHNLTLEMNRARQAEITQEILEVVGGASALG